MCEKLSRSSWILSFSSLFWVIKHHFVFNWCGYSFQHTIKNTQTHRMGHSITIWTCNMILNRGISHDLIHDGKSSLRPSDPSKKSSSDEGSDHKSRRETMRGDVPRFSLPRMAFERKKSLSLISWYGYNRKPRGMNMNLTSTRGKSLRELAGRFKSIKCEKGGKD